MKATLTAEALQGAIRTAAPFTSNNSPGFLLTAMEALTVTATNLDHSVRVLAEAAVDESGQVWVAGAFAAMVPHLRGTVTLATDESNLLVGTDTVGYTVACAGPEVFPKLAWPSEPGAALDEDDWETFARVAVAAYSDPKRGKMAAIHLLPDGFLLGASQPRMMWAEFAEGSGLRGHHAAIPKDAINLATKALKDPPSVAFTERTVCFTGPYAEVLCTLGAERFDEMPFHVVPSKPTLKLTVEAGPLLEALAAAAAVKPAAGVAHVRLDLVDGKLHVWRKELDVGEGHITVPAEGNWGEGWAFAATELAETVATLRCDPVVLQAEEVGRPVAIDGDALNAVVMPSRVTW